MSLEFSIDNLTKVSFIKKQRDKDKILDRIAVFFANSQSVNDKELQNVINDLFQWNRKIYKISLDQFVGLGELYDSNDEFISFFNKSYGVGFSTFLKKSIQEFGILNNL